MRILHQAMWIVCSVHYLSDNIPFPKLLLSVTLPYTKAVVFCRDERITYFMNLPPHSQSPEEPEQQPTFNHSEDTTQSKLTSDSHSEETKQPPVHTDSEDSSTQAEASSGPDETEDSLYNEDDTLFSTQSSQAGIFIHKGILIGAASAVLVAVLAVALLVFINRPQDPPTDWISSFTPPASSGGSGKILYYLHWTNKNGALTGQLQLAANPNGTPQSLTAPATGLYDRDNHVIYVVVTINGQPDTLTGTITNNDTLTLNQVGMISQDSQLVFHTGSASDYQQATKQLKPSTTPTPAPTLTPTPTATK
jgi:hypothetical protein